MASDTVKSAERTLDVLQLLGSSVRPVPTAEIVRACGIPRSSAHLLLNVMRDRGWVAYYPADRAWGLGDAAFATGSAYLRSRPLERLGRPLLEELTERTGCTTHLAVLRGEDVLYLDKQVPSEPRAPRLVTEVGVRLPAHLTSVGRALIAALVPDHVRALYVSPVLVRRTGRGPVTVGSLLRELDEVRAQGYALETGLTTPGIGCVGVAVLSHEGQPAAAIGATFAEGERDEPARQRLVEEVRAAAQRLSHAIGVRHRTAG